jgi:putative transcriptional regulator
MDDSETLKGRLLVATPGLVDANFFRTVVLLVEHNDEGAAGVVLNRPSDVALNDGPLEEWQEMAADPPLVFFGGPVQPGAAVCLARAQPHEEPEGFQPVIGGLGVVDIGREDVEIRPHLDRIRVFAGYAGWGAGQLESEIGREPGTCSTRTRRTRSARSRAACGDPSSSDRADGSHWSRTSPPTRR